ncbi:MAG TPA: DegV family protein [Chloroflexota bacterium]|jgi:DegV family protein with EDD domain|nr:DegV family protein [Chloroflexota bacterium]
MSTAVGVATDSTADLRPEVQERYGLAMVPLIVNWDGQTFRDKLDLTTRDFYTRLRASKTLPKTGAPSLAAFETAFREQLKGHAAVVSVNLASKLSGTYEVARKAAESVDPQRISVIDSGSVSVCLGWLAEMAATLANDGLEPAEIVSRLEEAKGRLRIFALVETLDFLQRGGRIGRAAALAGTLLSVKPILSIRDGEVAPVERVRTMNGALRRLVELVVASGPVERLGVVDADSARNADDVDQQLRAHYPDMTIDRGELGPVVGTHGGPGVVGVGLLLAR